MKIDHKQLSLECKQMQEYAAPFIRVLNGMGMLTAKNMEKLTIKLAVENNLCQMAYQALTKGGGNPNQPIDIDGNYPLDIAIHNGYKQMEGLLIELGGCHNPSYALDEYLT